VLDLAEGLRARRLDEAVVAAVLESLDAFVRRDAETLDDAFGLARAPGVRDARTRHAIGRRDELLRLAASRFCDGRPAAEQGRYLAERLTRYRESAWRRQRSAPTCPCRADTLEAMCWEILRAVDAPIGAERIRRILVANPDFS
jgi:hypothetical protein